ncbi:MAG: lipoyl(octanoyl) transferase LipB [Gammaproteobacteria bacterium]|nr:lipoyl(octanoyl) transferase LipB [Gammaproteobacteria bacterium]
MSKRANHLPTGAPLRVQYLQQADYLDIWARMKTFTAERSSETVDEFWVLEHPPVYTLGQAGKPEHLLNPAEIAVVHCDRGGQVTYHGPGQLIIYLLVDIQRLGIGVRHLVRGIENSVIEFLQAEGIAAETTPGAPGVYVKGEKIAALGLRIRKGCSYHGLSFNVDMDLSPFLGINPCGYEALQVTQLKDLGVTLSVQAVAAKLIPRLCGQLGFGDLVDER